MISKEAIENLLNDTSYSKSSMKYVKDITLSEWERLLPEKLYKLKTKPYKHQYACLYTGLLNNNFLFLASMGLGKCLHPDSLVTINDEILTIEEAFYLYSGINKSNLEEELVITPNKELYTTSYNQNNISKRSKIKGLYRQFIKENIKEIHLNDGSTIKTTMNHMFLTPNGWTNIISKNDYIAIPKKELSINNTYDANIDYTLVGWAIGEGYFQWLNKKNKRGNLSISQYDINILNDLKKRLEKISYGTTTSPHIYEQNRVDLSGKKIVSYFENIGFEWGLKSNERYIPSKIMEANRQGIVEFISAFFDAEGSINKGERFIEISSSSVKLINQLRSLLRKIDIFSYIKSSEKYATNTINKTKRRYYRIFIGGSDAIKFATMIKSSIVEKQKRLDFIKNNIKKINNNKNLIFVYDLITELRSNIYIGGSFIPSVYIDGKQKMMNINNANKLLNLIKSITDSSLAKKYSKKRGIGNGNYKSLLDSLKKMDVNKLLKIEKKLEDRIVGDLFFSKVDDIKLIPYEGFVYDLEIEENHNFISNHILVHNTKVILDIVSNKNPDSRILVLSPTILTVNVWAEQAKEHSDLSYLELTGTIQDRWNTLLELKNREVSNCEKEVDLILLNYTGLLLMLTDEVKGKNGKNKWEINRKKLKQFSNYFDGIVFDEIHLMKNKDSLTYKLCNTLSDNCTLRYGITGTPMNRNPIDLWSIFHLIDKGKTLGETISLYREAFFTAKKKSWGFKKGRELYSVDYSFKKELEPILQGRISTSSLRYSKEEALDLPKKVYIKRYYTLPEINLSSYNEEKEFTNDSLEDVENKYIKRRQICSGYVEYENEDGDKQFMEFDENPKLDLLMELINETEEDTKIVVVLEYIKSGDIVCDKLKKEKIGFERIYGGTKDKVDTKNRFINNSKCKVLVGNVKSIGLGLDGLQKVCSYLLIYESPPSNIDRQQLEDRLHRSGQKETTFIYDLVLEHKDSIEEKILFFLAEGKNYFSHIIDGRTRKNKNKEMK